MTDRRVDRSVASHLAGLEARVRQLEILQGGGRQQVTRESYISTFGEVASTSFGDPSGSPGPQVTIEVGRIGVVQFDVSATVELSAEQTVGEDDAGANIVLELSGANVLSADDWQTNHGYIDYFMGVFNLPAGASILSAVSLHRTWIIRDLDPGSTTVSMKYKKSFDPGALKIFVYERNLLAIPS